VPAAFAGVQWERTMENNREAGREVQPRLAYSIEEAARATNVGRTSLFAEIKAGRLKVCKFGKRTLITDAALRAWLQNLESAQQGSATVGALLLLAIVSAAALIFDSTHALAMAGPLLGLGAAARVADPDQAPEAVDQALDGERIARRGQHAARDGFAPPDRFLHDLLDLLAADGIRLAPTARLRAWCRTHQKHIESSPRT
jgi:excisionase family DNA binding protein